MGIEFKNMAEVEFARGIASLKQLIKAFGKGDLEVQRSFQKEMLFPEDYFASAERREAYYCGLMHAVAMFATVLRGSGVELIGLVKAEGRDPTRTELYMGTQLAGFLTLVGASCMDRVPPEVLGQDGYASEDDTSWVPKEI